MTRRKIFWPLAVVGVAMGVMLACSLFPAGSTPPASIPTFGAVQMPTLAQPVAPIEPTAVLVVELPRSLIQIDGIPYDAFQAPGDPFRFVCPAPCKVDAPLIYAQYAGFKAAHRALIQITGIDTLEELQPVDIHILNDPKCGALETAGALSFAPFPEGSNAYTCTFLFEYAQGFNGAPYTPDVAMRIDQQTILLHEYLHTIFYGRVDYTAGSMHDFVTPIALFATGVLGTDDICTYHPLTAPGDYGGWLINNMCAQNGFRIEKLAPALIALDDLYQKDHGMRQEGFEHLVPGMYQFRRVLNRAIGGDTSRAFAEACWPASLFGDNYLLSDACLHPTPTVSPTPVK